MLGDQARRQAARTATEAWGSAPPHARGRQVGRAASAAKNRYHFSAFWLSSSVLVHSPRRAYLSQPVLSQSFFSSFTTKERLLQVSLTFLCLRMRPTSFIPRSTTWLVPGDENHEIDVITIAHALGDLKKHVVGLQPCFGGKAYDITWKNETTASSAAASGVDIAGQHYTVKLLGRRALHVSIFVTCEFPNAYVIELMKQ